MKTVTIIYSTAALAVLASCVQRKEDPSEFAAKLLKEKGIEVPFHPSVDFPELMRQYKINPELWDAALECLAKNAPIIHDLKEYGRTELVGEKCFVMIDELNPKPFEDTKLEGHRKYIDIQLTEGPVRWGVCKADGSGLDVLEEYNPVQDIGFYLSDSTVYYNQSADKPYIFIFFPNDLHNPSFAAEGVYYEGPLKKIVIKVANAE